MRKLLLLLVLCAPLGWMAWGEGRRLWADWRNPVDFSEPSDADVDPTVAVAKKTAVKKADEVLSLSDELVRSAVALDDPPQNVPPGPIAKELADVGSDRVRRRRTVNRQQDEAADLVQKIEQTLERIRGEDGKPRHRPEEIKKLRDALRRLRELAVYDADLLNSAEAEADWPKLESDHPRRDLDELYDQIDRWTPGHSDSGLAPKATVKRRTQEYRNYLDTYGKVKGSHAVALVKEARERYELWSHGADLVGEINDWPSTATGRAPSAADAARIRAVAEMTASETAPAKLVASARRLVRLLSADLLPDEKLDSMVLVNDGGVPRRILRAQLGIHWKDGGVITLEKSGFNEFTLKLPDVKGLVFHQQFQELPKDGSPAISPTEYSKAVNAYNTERAQIKWWSGDDLSKLRRVCNQYAGQLNRGPDASGKTLPARIDALLAVVRDYPTLFSNDSN